MNIKKNLEKLLNTIEKSSKSSPYHQNVSLLAVTKHRSIEEINQVLDYGVVDIGENKVQEFLNKYEILKDNKDINWHFIGHLQRNKVKYLIGKIKLIHSVDSIRLLNEINKQSIKKDKVTDILIEVNISGEEQKYGFMIEEVDNAIEHAKTFSGVRVRGFMCMAPFTNDKNITKDVFRKLKKLYDKYSQNTAKYGNIIIDTLSMGMSGDYIQAIECGSNIVRIGTSIFKGED